MRHIYYVLRLRIMYLFSNLQRILGNTDAKEMILRRIEPWIQRELQAILKDPDPTVIVHVATSLFISRYEKKTDNFRGPVGIESDFLAPLRPFLHEHADLFWHELRYTDFMFLSTCYFTQFSDYALLHA